MAVSGMVGQRTRDNANTQCIQQYTFNVEMSCSGCSNAVNKALSRLEGVEKIDISLEKQEVVVDTELPRETVLAAIKKTGKTVKE
ncbi:Cytosolic copper metallochaperone [Mucor bainieri]